MGPRVEVWVISVNNHAVHRLSDTPLTIAFDSTDDPHPHDAAQRALAAALPAVGSHWVHSTAWRLDPDGAIVLVYLIVTKEAMPDWPVADLIDAAPRHAATRPPAHILTEASFQHAMRHLAFLVTYDAQTRELFGPPARSVISKWSPLPAGELPR